jgi:hypothetical protein
MKLELTRIYNGLYRVSGDWSEASYAITLDKRSDDWDIVINGIVVDSYPTRHACVDAIEYGITAGHSEFPTVEA